MIGLWFLHAWLALAAVPVAGAAVAAHLLNRRRQQPVRWAAMQFLDAAILQARRRLRLERWLLIALRTLMVALLCLFVARPIARSVGLSGGDDAGALLIVVDNGLAMQGPSGQPGQNLLAGAVEAVLPLVHGWRGPVAVMAGAGRQGVQWVDRTDVAEGVLSKVVPTAGRTDWVKVFGQAKGLAGECRLPSQRRSVVILTSLTRGSWEAGLLRQPVAELEDVAGRVLLLDVQPASRGNVAVTHLSVESAFAGRDLPVRVAATIANYSASTVRNLKVTWSVDGREVRQDEAREISVGASHGVVADLPVLTEGEHGVSVRVWRSPQGTAQDTKTPSDASVLDVLPADDQRWASVIVPAHRRIIVVEPEASAAPSNRASLFVGAVLSSTAQQSTVPVQVDVIAPAQLATSLIEPADAVVLCDVPGLVESDWQALKSHLSRGGGLVTWLGPRWAGGTADKGAMDVLPGKPGAVLAAPPQAEWFVQPASSVPLAVGDLDSSGGKAELLGSVRSLVKVDLASGAQVLAQAAGMPVALLRQVGRGRSVMVATSPDLSWANLASQPTFPAFVLGLLREAIARPVDGRQVICGEPIELAIGSGSVKQARWIKPDGSSEPANMSLAGGLTKAVLPVAAMPGTYQLEADGQGRTAFANADGAAGDLREVSEAARKNLVDSGVRLMGKKDLPAALADGATGEWAGPLAWLVLVLAAGEMVLTGLSTRQRRTDSSVAGWQGDKARYPSAITGR